MDKIKWIITIIIIGGIIMALNFGSIRNAFDNAREEKIGVAEKEKNITTEVSRSGCLSEIDLSTPATTTNIFNVNHTSRTGKVLILFSGNVKFQDNIQASPEDRVSMQIIFELKKDGTSIPGGASNEVVEIDLISSEIEKIWVERSVNIIIFVDNVTTNNWKIDAQTPGYSGTNTAITDRSITIIDL
jgi:hypothetical protein